MAKCDRVHKGKRCQNQSMIGWTMMFHNVALEPMRINACEDHMDVNETDLRKWAEAKVDRITRSNHQIQNNRVV